MTSCERYRDGLSALIDGEDPGLDDAALAAHVASCPACAAWEIGAVRATRVARVRPVEEVPDLTGSILAAIARERLPRVGDAAVPAVIRAALALVAVAQLLIALPALAGNDLGATIHVAHEQGAWSLALAAAFAAAAWRPRRAAAVLPLLSVFVGCSALLTLADTLGGRVTPAVELPHLMCAVGLALVWLEVHPPPGLAEPRPATAEPRVAA